MFARKAITSVFLGALFLLVSPVLAQRTPLRTGSNLFSAPQDVEMGRELVQEAEGSLLFSGNDYAHGYISALGNQLAVHAPGYKYPYEFRIYMDPAINSMALPGGVVYVSSGLVLASQTEPQLASVLAHQIGHVVARHGTQQVSRAYADTTTSRGRVTVTDAVSSLNIGFEADSILLKYTTQVEQQADVIGAQILYDARFDPKQLPIAFQRLVNQPARLKQEFFTNHPVPANRPALVRQELQNLGRLPATLRGDSPDLHTTQRHLMEETNGSPNDRISESNQPLPSARTPLPSVRTTIYQGQDFELRYPENWRVTEEVNAVTIAPNGGIVSGSLATGMTISTFEPQTQNRGIFGQNSFSLPGQRSSTTTLSAATDELINDFRISNPNMRVVRTDQRRVNGEAALSVELTNDSPLGGREMNRLVTVLRSNGLLYYFLGVAHERDRNRYTPIFDQILSSVGFY
jgi:beta-barrel assembly-enhancing protease